MHKTRETQIYVVHPVCATFMEKQPVLPSFYIIQQTEEIQLTADPL